MTHRQDLDRLASTRPLSSTTKLAKTFVLDVPAVAQTYETNPSRDHPIMVSGLNRRFGRSVFAEIGMGKHYLKFSKTLLCNWMSGNSMDLFCRMQNPYT